MDLKSTKQLADELLGKFGISNDFYFTFDDAATTCGRCFTYGFDPITKKPTVRKRGFLGHITLSRRFIENNSNREIEDTIRHEIAHAICNLRNGLIEDKKGNRDSHGIEWKRVAIEVGAIPRACALDAYIPKRFAVWCPSCNKKIGETELNQRQYNCKFCKKKAVVKLNIVKENAVLRDESAPSTRGRGSIVTFD